MAFFDLFPKTNYRIDGGKYTDLQYVTNITFRIGIIKTILSNTSAYYKYSLRDGETPEMIADKAYGDPQAHWIILYANDIYDPQYDWLLSEENLNKYIIDKYGSIETAKTTIHHYEKVIERENVTEKTKTTFRYEVDLSSPAEVTDPEFNDLPYDTYNTLPDEGSYVTHTVDGKTVVERTYRNAMTNYDWEVEQNEKKRQIYIIRKEYYPQIMEEMQKLTENPLDRAFVRKLV